MQSLSTRIRRARLSAELSQAGLALRLGLHRTAIAQWERSGGTNPSMENLIGVAKATGVTLDWLATGNGPMKPEASDWTPATVLEEYAHDSLESRLLMGFRLIPGRAKSALVALVDALRR